MATVYSQTLKGKSEQLEQELAVWQAIVHSFAKEKYLLDSKSLNKFPDFKTLLEWALDRFEEKLQKEED